MSFDSGEYEHSWLLEHEFRLPSWARDWLRLGMDGTGPDWPATPFFAAVGGNGEDQRPEPTIPKVGRKHIPHPELGLS